MPVTKRVTLLLPPKPDDPQEQPSHTTPIETIRISKKHVEPQAKTNNLKRGRSDQDIAGAKEGYATRKNKALRRAGRVPSIARLEETGTNEEPDLGLITYIDDVR